MTRRSFAVGTALLSASLISAPSWAANVRSVAPGALRAKLDGEVLAAGDPGYEALRKSVGLATLDERFPALIVVPQSHADIAHTLEFSRGHGLEIAVRSGGHDVLGASTINGGVVIDLRRMSAITVNADQRTAVAGAGARAGQLTLAAAQHGLAPVLGFDPTVGLGGLTLGGGIGWLCGTQGATVDTLLSVDLVTAAGRSIRANREERPELFWALRGGGGNFGVVTAFTYRLPAVKRVLGGDIAFRVEPARFMRFLREFLSQSPDELDLRGSIGTGPEPVCGIRLCWSGDLAAGERALKPLRSFAPSVVDTIAPVEFSAFANDVPNPHGALFARGGALDELSDEAIEVIAAAVRTPRRGGILIAHYLHGAITRVPASRTPLIRRRGRMMYNIATIWPGSERKADEIAWVLSTERSLQPLNSRQVYVNYLSHEGEQPVRAAYGPYYRRLQAIKRRYDPDNIFRNNRNIRP